MKFHNIFRYLSILFIVCGLCATLPAQNKKPPVRRQLSQQQLQQQRNQQLYATARSLIRVGRFTEAESILKTLLKSEPANISFYQTLLNSYLTRGALSEAEELVNSRIAVQQNDKRYEIDLGNVWYHQNKREEAMQLWQSVLKQNPKNLSLYNYTASAMMQNRLFDEPIEIYKEAIKNISRAHYLYQNIANIYKSRLMYVDAAFYYLKYLERNPKQQKYVYNRILALPVEPEARKKFMEEILKFEKDLQVKKPLSLLIAQLYQKHGNFTKAFEVYRSLDQKLKDEQYLIQFGKAARQDSAFGFAVKAYELFMNNYPQSRQLANVEYDYIKCLFDIAKLNKTPETAEQANSFIEKITAGIKRHKFWDRIKYVQGIFYLDFYFDVDKSIQIFNEILKQQRISGKMVDKTRLKLALAQGIRGDLTAAEKTYQKIKATQQLGPALLGLSQIYYFQQKWDLCKETINRLFSSAGIASKLANDALQLQFKLQIAEGNPNVLIHLSEADYLLFQRKKTESIKKLHVVLGAEKLAPDVKSDSYLKITQMNIELSKFTEALENSRLALSDTSIVDFFDHHLLLLGNLLEIHLQQPNAAFDAYTELLKSYPNSILADNARFRLQELRKLYPTDLP